MTLRIYGECLVMCREVAAVVRVVERKDPDLARQMKRAAASVALNTSEGAYSMKGNERARLSDALGSAAETRAAIEVAVAFGYVESVSPAMANRLDKIVATLSRLTR